ncbi:MAG: hypothetical protein MZV70_63060 [Desulfobacterales bacterium]|nr:hypothetical protein [Desulfobacterales bacterium]
MIQRKIGPQVVLVEASERLAARVAESIEASRRCPRPRGGRSVRLLVSDLAPQVVEAARSICGRDVKLEKAAGNDPGEPRPGRSYPQAVGALRRMPAAGIRAAQDRAGP